MSWHPEIPGIEIPQAGKSGIEKAAQATLAALDAEGLIQDRHALTCQVVMELARAVGHGLQAYRPSIATATLSKHLLEAIESLPEPSTGGSGAEALAKMLAEAEAAANGSRP